MFEDEGVKVLDEGLGQGLVRDCSGGQTAVEDVADSDKDFRILGPRLLEAKLDRERRELTQPGSTGQKGGNWGGSDLEKVGQGEYVLLSNVRKRSAQNIERN